MSSAAVTLFDDGHHSCIAYHSLVRGKGVQANQFLIRDGNTDILLDPGGDLLFAPLTIQLSKIDALDTLDFIFASHQDPDIIASMGRWMMKTPAQIICPKLWERFLPHLVSGYLDGQMGIDLEQRIVGVEDRGRRLPFGKSELLVLPAHFLHSVGNMQLFDPVSKILFSGDMGASIGAGTAADPVVDFDKHIQYMQGFHQRYMCANKACKLWVNMVRKLDIEKIVPQHGQAFVGKEMVKQFLDWIEKLECGVDLIGADIFKIPT